MSKSDIADHLGIPVKRLEKRFRNELKVGAAEGKAQVLEPDTNQPGSEWMPTPIIIQKECNAKKSTGPKTEAGRVKVGQNRLVHGLTGKFRVLPAENADLLDQFFKQLVRDEKPTGFAEVELVKKMAQHAWCAERAQRFMDACLFTQQTPEQTAAGEYALQVHPQLERFMRYQAHHNREYARAAAALLKRRKERREIENGFESQKRRAAEEQRRDKSRSLLAKTPNSSK